jgi:hypothetical protein
MKLNKYDRILPEYYIEGLIALVVIVYCVVRANGLSMTHDESATILDYVPLSFIDIMSNTPPSANNHIFNTLLVKLLIAVKNSPLVVRLPNLLALLLYLFYAFRLSHMMLKGTSSRILAFSILIINPYLLDFFSVARGYGLSLGFLMGSLYYLYAFTKTFERRHISYAIGFSIFAVWSNLTMLYYFLAMIALVLLIVLARHEDLKKVIQPVGIGIGILTLLIYVPLRGLIAENELYFGGKSGFYQDTFQSLIASSLYSIPHFGEQTTTLVQRLLLGISLLAVLHGMVKSYNKKQISGGVLWSSLLGIMIVGNLLQFYLFGTRYLVNRTALIYWPIFCLLWMSFLGASPSTYWQKIKAVQWVMIGFRWLIIGALCFHFYQAMNFLKVREWWYDRHTKGMIEYVLRHNPDADTLKLGAKWIFKPTINYYLRARNYTFVKGPGQGRSGLDTTDYYDYYYIEPSDKNNLHSVYELDTIMGSGNWLMKKQK